MAEEKKKTSPWLVVGLVVVFCAGKAYVKDDTKTASATDKILMKAREEKRLGDIGIKPPTSPLGNRGSTSWWNPNKGRVQELEQQLQEEKQKRIDVEFRLKPWEEAMEEEQKRESSKPRSPNDI